MATQEPIGLSELIERVKADLLSDNPADDLPPLFSLDEVKLELKVTVTREIKGGIKVYVVELGGGGTRDDVQTVTVTLTPWLSKAARLKSLTPEKKQQLREASSRITRKTRR